jgi:hypothetical protein
MLFLHLLNLFLGITRIQKSMECSICASTTKGAVQKNNFSPPLYVVIDREEEKPSTST